MEVKPSKAMRLFFDFNNHIMMTDDYTQERLNNVFIITTMSLEIWWPYNVIFLYKSNEYYMLNIQLQLNCWNVAAKSEKLWIVNVSTVGSSVRRSKNMN